MQPIAFKGWLLVNCLFCQLSKKGSIRKPEALGKYKSGPDTYMTIRVEVTVGRERVDIALPGLSSLALDPVKILPLP